MQQCLGECVPLCVAVTVLVLFPSANIVESEKNPAKQLLQLYRHTLIGKKIQST